MPLRRTAHQSSQHLTHFVPCSPSTQPQNSIQAAIAAAASALATSVTGLIAERVNNVEINTTDSLSGSGINATDNASPLVSSYVTCLLQRANGARFTFTLAKYTTPSSNYVAAAAKKKAPSAGSGSSRRGSSQGGRGGGVGYQGG